MMRIIFFGLFAIALFEGAAVFFPPSHKKSPMGVVMEESGLNSVEESNRKKIQQFDIATGKDLTKIRSQMDDLASEQDKFLDMIHRQQQELKDADQKVSGLIKQLDGKKDRDQQQLLAAHHQDLIALNDQLSKNRQWINEQIDLGRTHTESDLNALSQRYEMIQDQASRLLVPNQIPNSSEQQIQDLMQEERERSEEQQQMSRQRMQDREQLAIDQRLRQNNK